MYVIAVHNCYKPDSALRPEVCWSPTWHVMTVWFVVVFKLFVTAVAYDRVQNCKDTVQTGRYVSS